MTPLNQKTIVVASGAPPRPRARAIIPDHDLLRPIGSGSYGEVWLARNVMGTFRAVKIVYRDSFDEDRPYEREFAGIKKFEPLSRSHEGLMDILQIGRNDEAGYFYYVMELGDDQETGQNINPETYEARTLWTDLRKHQRLSFEQCLHLGLVLSSALSHLHKNGLIHRDIKPANIIFVNGLAQLADIGLVTEASEARTFVGTEGYIPPEGPGAAQADIYSLGKVFYEIVTGQDRLQFPNWPDEPKGPGSNAGLAEFKEIFLKCCDPDMSKRYQNCDVLYSDLVLLESGKSVKHLRAMERRLKWFTRFGITAAVFVTVAVGTYHWFVTQTKARLREEIDVRDRQAQLMKLARDAEAKARQETESDLYFKNIAFAQSCWAGNNIKRANSVLDDCPKGFRNWEWNYLRRVCHSGLVTFHGHTNAVNAVIFSPDGQQVASADSTGKIKIWNPSTGEQVREIDGFGESINCLAFSADGQRIAAGCVGDKPSVAKIKIWQLKTGRSLITLNQFTNRITSIAFSPHGKAFATGDDHGLLTLWNGTTAEVVKEISTGTNAVQTIAFSHSGKHIATGTEFAEKSGEVKIWNTGSGECTLTLSNLPAVYRLAFSRDGGRLAVATAEIAHKETFILRLDRGQVKLWDTTTGQELQSFQSHWGGVQDIAFSPDGKHLALACGTGTTLTLAKDIAYSEHISVPAEIMVCDLETGQEIAALRGHFDDVMSLAYSPDGQRLASASLDGKVKIWNPTAGQSTRVFSSSGGDFVDTQRPALSQDQRYLAIPETNGSITIWDVPASRKTATLKAHPETPAIAFGPADRLASVSSDYTVRIWNAANAREIARFTFAQHWVPDKIAFSPNGRHVAVAFTNAMLKVFDVPSGHELFSTEGKQVVSLQFSADNKFVAAGTHDGNVIILRARTGEKVTTLQATGSEVFALAFSHNKKWIATAGWGAKGDDITGVATIWDANTGKKLLSIPKTGTFFSVAFSPDDTRIATSTVNWPNVTGGEVNLWDTTSGQEAIQLSGNAVDLSFSEDGKKLLAVNLDGTVRIWNAEEAK